MSLQSRTTECRASQAGLCYASSLLVLSTLLTNLFTSFWLIKTIITSPSVEVRHIVISLSVCVAYLKNSLAKIPAYVLYMLPVAVARSLSDGNETRYVLSVLWMTSCFHIMV